VYAPLREFALSGGAVWGKAAQITAVWRCKLTADYLTVNTSEPRGTNGAVRPLIPPVRTIVRRVAGSV